ncbi:MAG: hypothetical protein ACE5IR_17915 [bacterium]
MRKLLFQQVHGAHFESKCVKATAAQFESCLTVQIDITRSRVTDATEQVKPEAGTIAKGGSRSS